MAGIEGSLSLFGGAVLLGVVHGAEPGHGWPVAATYALNRPRTLIHALAASTLLGLGHLVSSIAVVVVFFLAKDFFDLTQVGWIRYVAGALLILLGIREYRHGHSHDHGLDDEAADDKAADDEAADDEAADDEAADATHGHHEHSHGHDDHIHDDHSHGHDDHIHDDHGHGHHEHGYGHDDHSHDDHSHEPPSGGGRWARLVGLLPFVGGGDDHGHGHSHDHGHGHAHLSREDVDATGLWSIVGTAFVLGFAHEEEFEIIGLCLGSSHCLELMLVYAVAVLVALVLLTLGLVAGISRYEERLTPYLGYLPTISAAVLILLGLGFIAGVV